jgi:hypothetical protein
MRWLLRLEIRIGQISAKLGLHKSEWVDKMNNDDLLDFVNGGT